MEESRYEKISILFRISSGNGGRAVRIFKCNGNTKVCQGNPDC